MGRPHKVQGLEGFFGVGKRVSRARYPYDRDVLDPFEDLIEIAGRLAGREDRG
jgi:hypothetical protein